MDPADPQRHFAIVRDDFSPRPAYAALAARPWRGVAAPGVYAIGDPLIRLGGPWRAQTLGGRHYRLAGGREARVTLDFSGDRVAALARVSAEGGRLFVAIDGQPVPGLPLVGGRSYVSLQAARTSDVEVRLAAGLRPGHHRLELAPGDGEVALAGLVVSHERPLGWAFSLLHVGALGGLAWALGAALWALLGRLGVISPLIRPRPRRAHGWR